MADAKTPVKIREVEFPDIKDAWQGLEQTGDLPTIFQCYGWIEPWWRHLGRGKKILLAAYDGDLLVGIAPMFIERMTLKGMPFFNILRFMGTPESDYHAFILRQGYEDKTLSALLTALKQYSWDIAWLSDVKPDTATTDLLAKALKAEGLHFIEKQHTPCPYIKLPNTMDEYLNTLTKHTKTNIRTYVNRLSKAGDVSIKKVYNKTDVESEFDHFLKLHMARWSSLGQCGALAKKGLREFHINAANLLCQYLDLSFLTINGKRIATQYAYNYQNTRLNYLSGIDPAYEDYRVGSIMKFKLIENAIEEKIMCFDLMRGDEKYKYHFTKTVQYNRCYCFTTSRLKLFFFVMVEQLSEKQNK
ncbi:GNAT family N-acetyltransferase [Patescibacteria group bacterium]|nr:GNAT family N-acetyltransferase [Patescibacteria group bacterium]MBU1449229.1 GNAT family N-acetyltransferase [Patescibacteria group bacterium]MBU2594200.1 GNAT family N-acetyltransferase [Candidatus Edwardsbacteria bacterium]